MGRIWGENLVILIFMEIQASVPDSQKDDCNSALEGYEREFFWILTSLAMLYAWAKEELSRLLVAGNVHLGVMNSREKPIER